MLWKRGWLVDSIAYRVEKDIRDTVYKKEEFRNNRWSLLERLLNSGAKHYLVANLILTCLFILFSTLLSSFYTPMQRILPETANGLESLLTLQNTLFGVQITLLGLIFPLVIAFIGLLLRDRASNESMWAIYRHNSGFMLVGFSAITLSLIYVLSKVFEPWLSHHYMVSVSALSSVWFILNLLLSARFLSRTVLFLSSHKRLEMVIKYTLNVVIKEELTKRLLPIYHNNSVENGLLDIPDKEKFELKVYDYKSPETTLFKDFSKPERVYNIWYRFLSVGIQLWYSQVKRQKHNVKKPKLVLPFQVTDDTVKKLTLAKTDLEDFNFLTSFFIRTAVRTTSSARTPELNFDQFMGVVFAQIEDSLSENNYRLFEAARRNLILFYSEVSSSLLFRNGSGEPDSWLLLPESRWSMKNFLHEFINETTDLAKEVSRRIPTDANYYEDWCYLYPKIFDHKDTETPTKVSSEYINGHYYMWVELMSWLGGFKPESSVAEQPQDRAIKHFVGSWEYWHHLINSGSETTTDPDYQHCITHLENTSCMIVSALKNKNYEAAEWAVDVLVHWFYIFSHRDLGSSYFGLAYDLLTHEILNKKSSQELATFLREIQNLEDAKVASLVLKNRWADIRYASASYLMSSYGESVPDRVKKCIDALIYCNRLKPTGTLEPSYNSLSSPADILVVLFRQSQYWVGDSPHVDHFSEQVKRLAEIEEPDWVSGRIYSFSRDTSKSKTFFKVIGVGLCEQKFSLSPEWMRFLKSDVLSQRSLEALINDLQQIKAIQEGIDTSVCKQFEITHDTYLYRAELFEQSIDDIISDLKGRITEDIINTPVSDERLKEIGIMGTGTTFLSSHAPLPLSLFKSISYVDEFESDFTIAKLVGFSKNMVSERDDDNRAINEADIFASAVEQRAVVAVFQQLLQKESWQEKLFTDNSKLLTQAVEDSKSILSSGMSPIMFIGPWSIFSLLDKINWRYQEKENVIPHRVSRESGMPNGYICHLEDIEVYRLPHGKADFCIMLAEEAFETAVVKRFDEDRYVEASFHSQFEKDLKGDLLLQFGLDCEFRKVDSFKYRSLSPDD